MQCPPHRSRMAHLIKCTGMEMFTWCYSCWQSRTFLFVVMANCCWHQCLSQVTAKKNVNSSQRDLILCMNIPVLTIVSTRGCIVTVIYLVLSHRENSQNAISWYAPDPRVQDDIAPNPHAPHPHADHSLTSLNSQVNSVFYVNLMLLFSHHTTDYSCKSNTILRNSQRHFCLKSIFKMSEY